MHKKEKTNADTDDDFELLDDFQNCFVKNQSPNLKYQEKNLIQAKNSTNINEDFTSQTNIFSQNKITGTSINNKISNNQSNQTKRRQISSAKSNVVQSNFQDFQENQLKLPQIRTFNKGSQQIKEFRYKNIRLPIVQRDQLKSINKEKNHKDLLTERIPQFTKKNVQALLNKDQSSKLYSLHQKKEKRNCSQKLSDTLYQNKDQFLQYLKLKNNYRQIKQKNIQIKKNRFNEQKINLTDRKVIKQQKIQDLKKKTEQRKNQQKKIQQQKFFEEAKKKNATFFQIIKNCESKQEKIFRDQDLFFKKKISVLKSQCDKSKIKVGIQVKQQSQKLNEYKKDLPNFRIKEVKKTWQRLETMQKECPDMSRIISYEEMNAPVDEDTINKSIIMKQELNSMTKTKSELDQFAILLLKVTDQMQKHGKPVIMTQRSTVRSQISLRTLIGGFMDDTVKVQETISDYDPTCPFSYSQLQDPQEFQKFCVWYKIRTADLTGLDPNNIVIHCLAKGSIKVEWSTNESYVLDAAFVQKPQLKKKLKLHSFFQSFQLSPEDFDHLGNIQFFESKNYIQFRGGWPYYQPVKCKRYGINVKGKYDDGNDRWLQMKGRPGQWAVAFHAVRNPFGKCTRDKMTLQSIMSGLQRNQMLRPGAEQQRKNDQPKNRPAGEKVGVGIYCTPHIQDSFFYTKQIDGDQLLSQNNKRKNDQQKKIQELKKKYGLIFQCRVNPKQIKVSQRTEYWVINETKNIRPYGIILIKRDIIEQYPSIQSQFKKRFDYDDFKEGIQQFIKERMVD